MKRGHVRFGFVLLLVLSVVVSVQSRAGAQAWPTKPVRVIVPITAGSATDIIARIVSERVAAQLGQNFVVDNRPGATGTIGISAAAKAEADGYTALVQSSSFTVVPITYSRLDYDTVRDFIGITPLGNVPNILVISPSKGIRSVKDLIAAAKAKPGSITYASIGTGSATQLSAERFRLGAAFDGVHVPFKGTPEALNDVITGRVDFYFCPVISVVQFIKEGKLLALATGSTKRSSALPDVPTTLEVGIPNSDYNFWIGMMIRSKTPRHIVSKLHENTVKALQAPDTKERLGKLGAEPMIMTPAEFNDYIKAEIAANAKLIKAAGIPVN
ncbi:MAG TPA: tripartite tricarboxylate transporter substrate binding protein [Burkholderiales bacterium]|nr:tripartite tricarboxylate transporter substrate binding protein [Burkholderiales bacterium]